ncbi:hypothetical protein [Tolypothrix sp. VBCCA 56010]|uniref:hypothetical protein n=1 Tax=Tolypothrix sp. VBCCA 56010 TaxID=3137731 RepID=UPI003D7D8DDC
MILLLDSMSDGQVLASDRTLSSNYSSLAECIERSLPQLSAYSLLSVYHLQ